MLTSPVTRKFTSKLIGDVTLSNVWPLSTSDLLATVGRRLLISNDFGQHWEDTWRLPPSSGPMGVLPTAVARREENTYLGEYPLDPDATPQIIKSVDNGQTWSSVTGLSNVRHIHAVQRDPYTDDLWITTGDKDHESHIGRLRDGTFVPVGGGSQEWRAVELAFTPSAILWGMDCVYADRNLIFKLPRDAISDDDPVPKPVHSVAGSVFYSAQLTVNGDQWIAFSTAMESGIDSTGPDRQQRPDQEGVVVVASSASDFTSWYTLATFHRRAGLVDRLPGVLPQANGYVFLAADPDFGLLVNPFNTAETHGTLRQFSRDVFARLARHKPVG